ncbi:MAG: DNA polymerase III subunit alpha [Alphaproteobacteria bacterium]|nr:DNA polymerase III subunit alpha [Alphaproteobacteria bacterium]
MSHADFVHLRVHSAYSLSEGAIRIPELADLCLRHHMPAVGVADTNNLFGALEFSLSMRKAGVQPIIGCQLGLRRTDGHGANGAAPPPDPLVLLVQNEVGYRNLLALASRAHLETDSHEPPQITLEDLANNGAGLIALTGGLNGPIGRLLTDGQKPAAEEFLGKFSALFPGRLYVEVMRHNLAEEDRVEAELIDLAYRFDLPLVATNEVFFSTRDMHEAHDALICIAEGRVVTQQDRRRMTPEHYFKSAEEMRILFADLPEAVDNTLVIAQRCAYVADTRDPILPPYPQLEGRDEGELLRDMARAGLEDRLTSQVFDAEMDDAKREEAAKPYREQLDYELDVIGQMGFPGYFLIVADFIQWAKEQGIPVGPGRGSGAGSVVAWSLTITDLDPLRWGLLFERFLNPERISMPDFDIDFCKDGRDDVIRYVQQTYGQDRVAQIITFGKLEARAVLRDVGRVLAMPYSQVDRICKMVPNNPANPVRLKQAVDGEPALQEMLKSDESVKRLFDIAFRLEGMFRHASTHAAGVVIGDRPLEELVPLYRDPRSDMPVTQFNMKYVEQAGLVKFDFLGLKTLTVLARAVELLRRRGIEIDTARLPLDDAGTYEMFCRGDTTGVFQLESSGMRDVIKKLNPDRFEDIIALVSLYRPGPMDNIPSYIRRKHGEEEPDYMHPRIEGILKETHGIMIYQEQVMKIAQELSGYTLGGADLLRRAMGKKIKAEMEAQRKAFIDGAVAREVDRGVAGHIFEQVNKFAGYGFNKSHAAAYALVAYQTGYLKANYPVEFMAASMTLDMGNSEKLNGFRTELDRLDIRLLGPDVNRSGAEFTVEALPNDGYAVRYALAAIKNVGQAAMEVLVAEREANGPFKDLTDFANRLDSRVMNKRQIENLARAGAFDSLNPHRRQVYEAVEYLIRHASAAQNDRESNQVSLFGEALESRSITLPDVDDWPTEPRLQQEYEAIGFYLSAHPLESYAKSCERMGVVQWAEVAAGRVREPRVKLAGIVGGRRIINGRRGKLAFVQMSDTSGAYEVTVFSELLASCREMLESGAPLLVTADIQSHDDSYRVTAIAIQELEDAAADAAEGLRIFLREPEPVDVLVGVFREHSTKGRGRVTLVLDTYDQEVEMVVPGGFRITPAMRSAVKAIPGIVDVHDI